jgi:type I restriction enzyme S subunit
VSDFPLVKLSEVVRINPRNPDVVPAEADHVTFVPMAAVEAETGRFNGSETREWSAVKKGYTRFQENDVLVAKITPCMENGKACVARHLQGLVGAGSTEFHVLRPITSKVEPEWILRFVNQRCVRHEAKRHMSGAVGQQRVPASFYQDLQLPLPDLKTQQELLERLEDHDVKIDATERALFAIQAKLKQARASILKAAVEGRLVETEPGPTPQSDEHTQLPSGWVWSTLGAQFSIHIGATPKRNDPSLWGGEIPWVSSGEIQFNRITKTKETITQSGLDNTSTQLHPKGTVLLAMIGQGRTRGQAAILEIEACTNQNCAAIRMNDSGCNSKYVYWWLYYRYDQTRQLGGGNNQQALNKKRVSEISISLPLPEEQNRIVEAIEHRFSILDQVEATVNASLRRCGQLRQAVLKRALEGCRSR